MVLDFDPIKFPWNFGNAFLKLNSVKNVFKEDQQGKKQLVLTLESPVFPASFNCNFPKLLSS